MPRFAILMREDDDAWARMAESERDAAMKLYGAWVGDLRARGAFKDGAPLGREGCVLRREHGAIVQSPIGTKRVLTGYFLVEAADLAAAVELARGCPALGHGESVEVRAIGHE